MTKEAKYYSKKELPLKPAVDGAAVWGVALDKTLLTYFEIDPNSEFVMHTHESEQITMVLEGELYFKLADKEIKVGAGEVIAMPSNVPHGAYTKDKPAKAVDAWSPVMEKYK